MRGGRRIARRRGSAVNPRRDRLALFGRARGCTSWAVRFDSWERRGGGWYGQWWPLALALALAVSVLRVEQRVGVSPTPLLSRKLNRISLSSRSIARISLLIATSRRD